MCVPIDGRCLATKRCVFNIILVLRLSLHVIMNLYFLFRVRYIPAYKKIHEAKSILSRRASSLFHFGSNFVNCIK